MTGRTLISAACGAVVGLGAWLGFTAAVDDGGGSSSAPDELYPPASAPVVDAAENLADEPLHVDAALAHLLDDADRRQVLDRLDSGDGPVFVALTRTGREDGYGGLTDPRAYRIAQTVGEDGWYLVVDQGRTASALHKDGDDVVAGFASVGEGLLADELVGQIDTLAGSGPPDESGRAVSDSVPALIFGALAGGVAYLLGRLLLGAGRVVAGYPFAFSSATRRGSPS